MLSKTHRETLDGSILEAKYPGSDNVFDCDLSTAHYALRLLTSSENQANRGSPARQNGPTGSQKWFIDDFLGITKQKRYQEDWTDSNEWQLTCEIPSVIESLDPEVLRTLYLHSPQCVRHAARYVPSSAVH